MSAFLIGVILTTLLALVALMGILVYLEPLASDVLIMSLFYLSLFVSASGLLSLVGIIVRRISRKSRTTLSINCQLWDSFRQGVFLAVILIGSLLMQSNGLACWWSLLVLVGMVGLLEFIFLRR